MRKLILFFLFSYTLQAAAQNANEQAILNLMHNQAEAWNKGDLENFMKGYWQNDSLMFIGKSGITYGYNQTLANYKKGYPDTAAMGQLTFSEIKFKKLSKEYYYVTGKWFLQRKIGDVGGYYTLLFRRIQGEWVIISDHSS